MAMDCKKWQLSTLIEWYAVSGGYPVVRGIPPFLDVFIKWTNGNSLARSGSHAAFVPLPVAKSGMCSKYLFQAIWLSSNVIGLASICSFFLSGIFGHLIVSLQFFFWGGLSCLSSSCSQPLCPRRSCARFPTKFLNNNIKR